MFHNSRSQKDPTYQLSPVKYLEKLLNFFPFHWLIFILIKREDIVMPPYEVFINREVFQNPRSYSPFFLKNHTKQKKQKLNKTKNLKWVGTTGLNNVCACSRSHGPKYTRYKMSSPKSSIHLSCLGAVFTNYTSFKPQCTKRYVPTSGRGN